MGFTGIGTGISSGTGDGTLNSTATVRASANYNANVGEHVVMSGGNVVNLPDPVTDGYVMVSPHDVGSIPFVQDPRTGETIEGDDGVSVTAEYPVVFLSDGSNWYVSDARDTSLVIPDSATNQWLLDEGSGTTLADNIGSQPATLQAGTWASETGATGDVVLDLDGTDDWWITDSTFACNGQKYSVATWVYLRDTAENGAGIIIPNADGTASYDPFENQGWDISIDRDQSEIELRHNGASTSTVIASLPASTDTWYLVGASGDGDSATGYLYDKSGFINSSSGTGARDGIGDPFYLAGGVRDSRYQNMQQENTTVSATTTWGRSEFDQYHESTTW